MTHGPVRVRDPGVGDRRQHAADRGAADRGAADPL